MAIQSWFCYFQIFKFSTVSTIGRLNERYLLISPFLEPAPYAKILLPALQRKSWENTSVFPFSNDSTKGKQLSEEYGAGFTPGQETQGSREALEIRNLITDRLPLLNDSVDRVVVRPHMLLLLSSHVKPSTYLERGESP